MELFRGRTDITINCYLNHSIVAECSAISATNYCKMTPSFRSPSQTLEQTQTCAGQVIFSSLNKPFHDFVVVCVDNYEFMVIYKAEIIREGHDVKYEDLMIGKPYTFIAYGFTPWIKIGEENVR